MAAFNAFFAGIAEKIGLPEFFSGSTLFVNNLFLALVGVVLLTALLLVAFLMPGKKKKVKAKEDAEAPAETELGKAPEAAEAPKSEYPKAEEPVTSEAETPEVAASPKTEEVAPAPAPETPAPVMTKEAPLPKTAEAPKESPAKEEPLPASVVTLAEAPSREQEKPAPTKVLEKEREEARPQKAEESIPPVEKNPDPVGEKKTAKKAIPAEKSEEESEPKSLGKYEIIQENGAYYFLLKANNGQLLLRSSDYASEIGAKKAIDTFKKTVETGDFRIDADKNGNFKFVLRAPRSQMLYYGESYRSRQSAESAIQSVKNFAFHAVIRKAIEANAESDAENAVLLDTPPMKESDYKLGGKYEIEVRNGNYYFLLKANNGQLLLESPAFTTEQGARNGIDSFKKATETGIFMIYQDKNGNYKFILRASARARLRYFGESYSTRQSAENSVKSVRAFAIKAEMR